MGVITTSSPKLRQNPLFKTEQTCYYHSTLNGVGKMAKKIKRKRGGQPGNQNARKHGLYSSTLSAGQVCELSNRLNAGGRDPGLIALRIKMASALKSAPNSYRVFMEASKILSKWYLSNANLGRKDNAFLKTFVRGILKMLRENQPVITEQIVAKSPQKPQILTERIESKNNHFHAF